MEKVEIEKAIYQAIWKIRANRNRSHADKISKSVAKNLGLDKDHVKEQLESLVETGMVYITLTAKGEDSYFNFDIEKYYGNESIRESIESYKGEMEFEESRLRMDNVLDGLNQASSPNNPVTETDQSEYLVFLDIFSKLTDDIRDLNNKLGELRKKKSLENNYMLILENLNLKAQRNERL